MPEPSDEQRRKVLKTIGVSAAVGAGAATGCIGGNGGGNGDGGNGEDGGDGNTTDDGGNDTADDTANGTADGGGEGANETAADGEAPTTELVEFPEDAHCPVCNMVSADYPDWNAQVAHEDGERAHLCTSGCLVAYKAYPDEFGVTDAEIASVWVTSYETKEMIDGIEASYALENNPDRVDDPMMTNPAPFEERANAVEYVDAVDYLTEDDIVGYDAFDTELADSYRGQLTPNGGA